MIIREATASDYPEIISVLKASLGEADLPLSEEIWNYKHIDNPFGKSLVLVAIANERIAGVRAFMKWKWQWAGKSFSAVRAVDTATHPDFQGKGIFKKLTLNAVEVSIRNGENFVFNTPNDNSRPGYLKMGWEKAGNIRVGIKPAWNSFFMIFTNHSGYNIHKTVTDKDLNVLCDSWNLKLDASIKLFTPKSAKYLYWRYENNPLQNYQVHADKNFYLAGYVKHRKKVKELRIVECLTNDHPGNKKIIDSIIKTWQKRFGVQIVTISGELEGPGGFNINSGIGPILTVRELQLAPEDKATVINIENWAYSLGDLELF